MTQGQSSIASLMEQAEGYNVPNMPKVEIVAPIYDSSVCNPCDSLDDRLILEFSNFQLRNSGLFFKENRRQDRDDSEYKRIGNYIKLIARTVLDKISYLLLEFKTYNNEIKDFIIDRGNLADAMSLTRTLLSGGYEMDLYYKKQLQSFLNTSSCDNNILATKQIGWFNNSYVLPHTIIGSNCNIRYYGTLDRSKFISNGTLEEWQINVAHNCIGHEILELSLYAGFASILTHFVEFGFGLHFNGNSSGGKTTALRLSSSIFGKPNEYMNKWHCTQNGVEFIGYNSNHALCVMDEINEAAKTTLESVYMLIDGKGKGRAVSRNGHIEQSKSKTWKTIVLSSGEISIEDLAMQYGKSYKAGESVRILDIEVGKICRDKDHADLLIENTNKYYGEASIAFIEYIQQNKLNIMKLYNETYKAFIFDLPDLNSQSSRVAKYFALMHLSGDIAKSAKILQNSFNPEKCTKNQFKSWLSNNKTEKESKQVTSALISAIDDCNNWFISTYEKYSKPNMIGYLKDNQFYVLSTLIKQKLFKKSTSSKEMNLLKDMGIINNNMESLRVTQTTKKVYKINLEILDKYRID